MRQFSPFARIGAVLWILGAVVFFTFSGIAQAAWTTPYSWAANTVSDLGNVTCQPWGDEGRYVCSPLHALMNVGFIIEGVCLVLGLFLVRALWRHTLFSRAVRAPVLLGMLVFVLVGFVPADVSENWHVFGAFLLAFVGNPGLLFAGFWMQPTQPGIFRWLATILGGIGVVAMLLFFSQHYLGLGLGGMERLWGYTLIVWTFVMGCYVLLAPARKVQAL